MGSRKNDNGGECSPYYFREIEYSNLEWYIRTLSESNVIKALKASVTEH